MREETGVLLHGQYMQVVVQGSDYESALADAAEKLAGKVLNKVHLVAEEAQPGDWYVAGTYGQLSAGGIGMQLQVTFKRCEP